MCTHTHTLVCPDGCATASTMTTMKKKKKKMTMVVQFVLLNTKCCQMQVDDGGGGGLLSNRGIIRNDLHRCLFRSESSQATMKANFRFYPPGQHWLTKIWLFKFLKSHLKMNLLMWGSCWHLFFQNIHTHTHTHTLKYLLKIVSPSSIRTGQASYTVKMKALSHLFAEEGRAMRANWKSKDKGWRTKNKWYNPFFPLNILSHKYQTLFT